MRSPPCLLALLPPPAAARPLRSTRSSGSTDVVTGWFDAGVTDDGKNKIVPSISLKLTNTSGDPTGGVQLNCIFRRVGDPEEWSTALVRVVDTSGLDPGATSTAGGRAGAAGLHRHAASARSCCDNRLFIDAKVEVFGKHGSATWVKLGDFRIDRQLLTR